MNGADDSSFEQKTQSFVAWLRHNGASISHKIDLADLRHRSAGRGMVAQQNLIEDEELFRIPRSSILTAESSNVPTEALTDLSDAWLSLILAMVFENLRGARSHWQAYFHVLPKAFDTLMFWSADEVGLLEGSAVLDKIGYDGANRTFELELIPRIKQYADAFAVTDLSDGDLLALCHRMGSTIMAYAFDLERTSTDQSKNEEDGWEEDSENEEILPKGMVPLADMLNADADRNNAKLFYEDEEVVMKTIKPVKAGEELFNDYGSLPRADVLRRYGYVTDNYAKYDVVEISIDLIKERAIDQSRTSATFLNPRLEYADEQGVLDTAYDISRRGSEEGQFPDDLCILLNLLTLPGSDFDKMKKKEKLPKAELSDAARALLQSVLVYRYSKYRLDSEWTSGTDQGQRFQMAQKVIEGEKQVLQEAANTLASKPGASNKRRAETLEEEAKHIRAPAKR